MIFPLKHPFIGSFPHDCPIKKTQGHPLVGQLLWRIMMFGKSTTMKQQMSYHHIYILCMCYVYSSWCLLLYTSTTYHISSFLMCFTINIVIVAIDSSLYLHLQTQLSFKRQIYHIYISYVFVPAVDGSWNASSSSAHRVDPKKTGIPRFSQHCPISGCQKKTGHLFIRYNWL